jgi:hypothetical protein
MMSLEQAIEHAEEVANDYEDMTHDYALDSAKLHKCANEHRQLAAWLRELLERRKSPEIIHCSECVYSNKEYSGEIWCGICNGFGISEDSFCSFAERRTE